MCLVGWHLSKPTLSTTPQIIKSVLPIKLIGKSHIKRATCLICQLTLTPKNGAECSDGSVLSMTL